MKTEAVGIESSINTSYFERIKGKPFLKNVLKLSEGINKHMDASCLIDFSTWISRRPLKGSFAQAFLGTE